MELKRYAVRRTNVRADYRNPGDKDQTVDAGSELVLDSTQANEIDSTTWMALAQPASGWVKLDDTSDIASLGVKLLSASEHAQEAAERYGKWSVQHAAALWHAFTAKRHETALRASGRSIVRGGGQVLVRGTSVYGVLAVIARMASESPAFEQWIHTILRPLLPYLALLGSLLGPLQVPDAGPVSPEPLPTPTAVVTAVEDAASGVPGDMEIVDGLETATVDKGWNVHSCPDLTCSVFFTTVSTHDVRILATQDDFVLIQGDGSDGSPDLGWVVEDALKQQE